MKQNPKDIPVLESLRAGILTTDGFMGEDTRSFPQIILDDAALLDDFGLSAQKLAEKMVQLTKAGLEAVGSPVPFGEYEVTVDEYMGRIGCPFRDHRAPKRTTTVRDKTGKRLMWTDLSVHLIKAHGFFQGIGSPYRLEPSALAEFLKDLE